jgi:hypothetical protein
VKWSEWIALAVLAALLIPVLIRADGGCQLKRYIRNGKVESRVDDTGSAAKGGTCSEAAKCLLSNSGEQVTDAN